MKVCGILGETDDSEDGDINCLELVKMEAEAAPEIAWLTFKLESRKILATLSLTSMTTRMNEANKLLVGEDHLVYNFV